MLLSSPCLLLKLYLGYKDVQVLPESVAPAPLEAVTFAFTVEALSTVRL
jgi:hypothetical protein